MFRDRPAQRARAQGPAADDGARRAARRGLRRRHPGLHRQRLRRVHQQRRAELRPTSTCGSGRPGAGGDDIGPAARPGAARPGRRPARRRLRHRRGLRLRRTGRPGRPVVGEGWATAGANYDGAGTAARYPMVEGRAPAAEGEVAIDARTAERTGYRVGDTVRLSVSGPVLERAGHRDLHHRRRQRRRRRHPHPLRHRHRPAPVRRARPLQPDRPDGRAGHHPRAAAPGRRSSSCRTASRPSPPPSSPPSRRPRTPRASARSPRCCSPAPASRCSSASSSSSTPSRCWSPSAPGSSRCCARSAPRRRQVTRSVLVEAALVGLVASAAGLAVGIGIGAGVRARAVGHRRHAARRAAGHRRHHRRRLAGPRRRRHPVRRLAAGPPRREDPAGGRDEQRARAGHQPRRWWCATPSAASWPSPAPSWCRGQRHGRRQARGWAWAPWCCWSACSC